MKSSAERAMRMCCVVVAFGTALACNEGEVAIGSDPAPLNASGNGGQAGSAGNGNGGNAGEVAPACFPPAPWPKGSGREFLIDDFADNDTKIPLLDARFGEWTVAKDDSEMGAYYAPNPLLPTNGELAVKADLYGAAVEAGGYGWGFSVSVFLNGGCPYDASNYAGISFRAKGTITQQLWVQVAMPDVIPRTAMGGTCPANNAEEVLALCNNKHHKAYVATDLKAEYQTYTVLWSELRQGSWGYRTNFSPAVISYIEFAFPQLAEKTTPSNQARFVSLDVAIDDVKFIGLPR